MDMKHIHLPDRQLFILLSILTFLSMTTALTQDRRETNVPDLRPLAGKSLTRELPTGLFRKKSFALTNVQRISLTPQSRPTISVNTIRARAENLSRMKMLYVFGGSTPADGGLDCSGSIQCLLAPIGYGDFPRTSYAQYDWMQKNSRIRRSKTIDARQLNSGDLIFWGGTYKSGHKVSHVMLFMGNGTDGRMYMFGARGKGKTGISGAGVDIWELRPGSHKNLIGFGTLPGLSR